MSSILFVFMIIYVASLSCETRHFVPLYVHACSEMTLKLDLTWLQSRVCITALTDQWQTGQGFMNLVDKHSSLWFLFDSSGAKKSVQNFKFSAFLNLKCLYFSNNAPSRRLSEALLSSRQTTSHLSMLIYGPVRCIVWVIPEPPYSTEKGHRYCKA